MNAPFPTPAPPTWAVPWEEMDRGCPLVRNLRGCPQDPVHHAEGDVWVHTRMVCEELAALPAWRALPEEDRAVLFAAAVLHDVGKPERTRTEPDGRISSRGHSRRGSILARRYLWETGFPFALRERVASLVRYHQVPYFLLDRDDPQRLCIEVSQSTRCDHLALLAEADVRGRVCADRQRLLDNVALFAEYAREQGCLSAPFPFPSDHSRFLYFTEGTHYLYAPAHEDFSADAVVMSGLPGSGKDHHIRTHLPHLEAISLDALRAEMGVDPADRQGEVVEAARERARECLRRKVPLVWNATNISRQLRGQVVRLLGAYRARVRILYLEVPPGVLLTRNREREARVPEAVLDRLMDRWEVPDRTEAHEVDWVVREGG
jgi:predicted kinase